MQFSWQTVTDRIMCKVCQGWGFVRIGNLRVHCPNHDCLGRGYLDARAIAEANSRE